MPLQAHFLEQMREEAFLTRQMLAIIPNDKYDWKPHAKSMSIRTLATHIAELPGWVTYAYTTDELDFATSPYNPPVINTTDALLALFDESLKGALEHLKNGDETILSETWVLRNGEVIFMTLNKTGLIRHAISQIIHHRAQLGVFLRLLDIPIPGTYGPSADDSGSFV